jgi:hypothetical protein
MAPPTGVARALLFPEPMVDQAARDVVANRRIVKDYAGAITPTDITRIQGIVDAIGAKGFDMRVVFLPNAATRPQSFTDRVYPMLRPTTRDILVVGSPRGVALRASGVRRPDDLRRIAVANQGQFAISFGQGMYSVSRDIAGVLGMKVDRVESRKKVWIYVVAGVGGLIFIIIIFAVIRSRQRKAAELAEYAKSYERATELMDSVASKLGDLQLSVQIVDDEDAKMLLSRGEANYFGAQGLLNKIPSPGKGEPNMAGARRLVGQLQEALEALEKAEMIVSRKVAGKPIDKDKILAEGGKKLGCYFCSKPMRDESAGQVVGIQLKGEKMDVLVCNTCAAEYKRGGQPKIRMVEYEGKPVHWSMVPGYDPWYDYYHYDRYHATWVDMFVLASLWDWGWWHAHPNPYLTWYPYGTYHYGYGYEPVYYDIDSYARDRDVDAVIGDAWTTGGTPTGVEFAGAEYAGGGSPESPEAAGGGDVS